MAGARADDTGECWLCGRQLGPRVEWHHPVPKSRGGRDTVPVHPICHAAMHRHFTNAELAVFGDDAAALRRQEAMAAFLRWIAGKPPGFHAPTRKRRT
ncbi:HNH endonuclease [Oricola sp.]|uniref:HNH endonuclease n=1 Tax=Oricola sp. TaxID=1979950 RepID=UPI0025EB1563|nr:HNH endonuclease [Oricola sp.]MCI5078002.1 HNH endonuclease [Oricola sp.]